MHNRLAIDRQPFGRLVDGTLVEKVRLFGRDGFEASIITYGAALQSLVAPDRSGRLADVVLGADTIAGYEQPRGFLGATIGRYANRIDGGAFTLDGWRHRLATNEGPNTLHGGEVGFDRRCWTITAAGSDPAPFVTLSHVSPNGDEGFPGELRTDVTYRLSAASELSITFAAVTDRPTVVNLTNHSFFNLAGADSEADILDHQLEIAADSYLPVRSDGIPLGPQQPVEGTPFDFRRRQAIGALIDAPDSQLGVRDGYDHNFCLRDGVTPQPRLAARVTHPGSGRVLELLTDQPGLQFYSGNFLDGSVRGKSGQPHRKRGALCLEPQDYPDAPNRPAFPSTRLDPCTTYRRIIVFRLSTA
jgi:aldose 1-epimerase